MHHFVIIVIYRLLFFLQIISSMLGKVLPFILLTSLHMSMYEMMLHGHIAFTRSKCSCCSTILLLCIYAMLDVGNLICICYLHGSGHFQSVMYFLEKHLHILDNINELREMLSGIGQPEAETPGGLDCFDTTQAGSIAEFFHKS